MKFLIILLLLSGCATTYHAETTNPDTGTVTVLDVRSNREFKGGIEIEYDRARGVFILKAGEVTDGGANAMRDVILSILPLLNGGP